jgi:hypothetical protein
MLLSPAWFGQAWRAGNTPVCEDCIGLEMGEDMTNVRKTAKLSAPVLAVLTFVSAVMIVRGGGPIEWVIVVIFISVFLGSAIYELLFVRRGKETRS